MIYFQSTPEFRFLVSGDDRRLQVRYINSDVGYTGSWGDVPIVEEDDEASKRNASSDE